jgi:hypothetical protein
LTAPSLPARRHLLATAACLLALAVPAASFQVAERTDGAPGLLIVADAAAGPMEAARILKTVAVAGGYGQAGSVRLVPADGAEAFRAAVAAAPAGGALALAAHGEADGLHLADGAVLPWAEVAALVEASRARQLLVLACHSAGLGAVEGVEVLLSYEGTVDLEVAALDAAHRLATANLEGPALAAFGDAHTAYMVQTGGPLRYVALQAEPERPLDMTACRDSWTTWRQPYYSPSHRYYDCASPMYLRPNPSCTWREFDCRGYTAEHQKKTEKHIEEQSSAKVKYGVSKEYLNGMLEVKMGANVDGKEYEVYVSYGGPADVPQRRVVHRGQLLHEESGSCVRLVDVGNFIAPALTAVEAAISALPAIEAETDVLALYVCAVVQGGIVASSQAVTGGTVEGIIEFRAQSGVRIGIDLWFYTAQVEGEMSLSYPVGVKFDIEHSKPRTTLHFSVALAYGPFEFVIKENVFNSYWALEIPLLTGKKDVWHYDWNYGGSAAAMSASASGPGVGVPDVPGAGQALQAAVAEALRLLPPGAALANPVDAVAMPSGTEAVGRAVPLADLLELRRGDAFLNWLEGSGALARLGVDPAAITPGTSLYLDLADPATYEALYQEPSPRPPTLLGLPGGFALAASGCQSVALGEMAAVFLEDCDATKPIVGLEGAFEGDPAVAGVQPTAIAKGASAGAALGAAGTAGRTACVGTPVATLPETGRQVTLSDVCRWLTHDASAGAASDMIATALHAHNKKLVLDQEGLVGWLTDPCTLNQGLQAEPLTASLCMTFHPPGNGALTKKYVADVLAEYEEGHQRIMDLAHGGGNDPSRSAIASDLAQWSDHEPLTTVAGQELAFLGDPLGFAFELEKRAECTVTRPVFNNPPDCHNVPPLV